MNSYSAIINDYVFHHAPTRNNNNNNNGAVYKVIKHENNEQIFTINYQFRLERGAYDTQHVYKW